MENSVEIREERLVELIKKSEFSQKLEQAFLTHLIAEWKKHNPYKTKENRATLVPYIRSIFFNYGIKMDCKFNNYYCNSLRVKFGNDIDSNIYQIVSVDFSTGDIKE